MKQYSIQKRLDNMNRITPTEALFIIVMSWTVMYAVAQIVVFFN